MIQVFPPLLAQYMPENPFLAALLSGLGGLSIYVLLNVLEQLIAPRDPSLPPLVFHIFPWIGSAVSYGMDPYAFFEKNRKKYGDVFAYVMTGRTIVVALGPAGSDLILNGKIANVSAEEAYTNFTTPVFGTEVVYDCPNALLMQQKKFMKFGLSTENFRKYVGIIVDEVVQYLEKELLPADTKSKRIDTNTLASEITILTASATLQGKEVRASLDKSFAKLYHDLDGGFTPINFVFPNLPLPSYRKRDAAHIKMRHFYMDIISNRRKSGTVEHIDMLQALVDQEYKDGTKVTDKQVAHMMIALLMAGQHTSAATTSWLLCHIGHDQKLQQDLYDEQVKQYGNPDGTLRPLNYDTLQTPLLKACVREVLRMHPPIHSIMRYVKSDLAVPPTLSKKSLVIPKGYYVLAAPGASAMDPTYFDQPDSFQPLRWQGDIAGLAEEGTGQTEDFGFGAISTGANSPYLPFGAGRHRCIGEQFAYLQLATIIATLVRETVWTLDGPVPGPDYSSMLVSPKQPRVVTFTRRSS